MNPESTIKSNKDTTPKPNKAAKNKIEEQDDSSDEDKDTCSCRKGCATGSCSCFKEGGGCSASCGCKGKCRNMFNHLDYFFGSGRNYSAHPCFAQWLKKNVKNADGLQMVDRDNLRRRIVNSSKYEFKKFKCTIYSRCIFEILAFLICT